MTRRDNVTPVREKNPLQSASDLYNKIVILADARHLGRVETEMTVAMMIASCLLQVKTPAERIAVAQRLCRQAEEFIEMELIITVPDDEPDPGEPA